MPIARWSRLTLFIPLLITLGCTDGPTTDEALLGRAEASLERAPGAAPAAVPEHAAEGEPDDPPKKPMGKTLQPHPMPECGPLSACPDDMFCVQGSCFYWGVDEPPPPSTIDDELACWPTRADRQPT